MAMPSRIHSQPGRERVRWAFLLWSKGSWWQTLSCCRRLTDVLLWCIPSILEQLSLPLHLSLHLLVPKNRYPRSRLCRRRG
eukprot:7478474-Heterocapsa_arctica.AAC.1